MRSKLTRAPYECCGKPAGFLHHRGPCADCQALMDDGRAYRELMTSKDSEKTEIAFPSYGKGYYEVSGMGTEHSDNLRESFKAALYAVSSAGTGCYHGYPREEVRRFFRSDGSMEMLDSRVISADAMEAFQKLDLAIRKGLLAAFAEGVGRGSSLITRLAHGEISAEDVNRETVKGRSEAKTHYCPMCEREDFLTMAEMVDHLRHSHAKDVPKIRKAGKQ